MPQKHKLRHTGPSKPQLCGGKRCYKTRTDADIVKTEQEIINPELTLNIYHCTMCGNYHLTRTTLQ